MLVHQRVAQQKNPIPILWCPILMPTWNHLRNLWVSSPPTLKNRAGLPPPPDVNFHQELADGGPSVHRLRVSRDIDMWNSSSFLGTKIMGKNGKTWENMGKKSWENVWTCGKIMGKKYEMYPLVNQHNYGKSLFLKGKINYFNGHVQKLFWHNQRVTIVM